MKAEPPVQATQDGDSSTPLDFTTFMRNYQNMVFATASRLLGNDRHAEDIAQEVFLKAYEHFNQLKASPSAGGWLKTVTTNLSLNYLTRYRNRWRFFSESSREDEHGEAITMDVPDPEHFLANMEQDERRVWVAEALNQLPDHQRIPLVLYHFEEFSYEAIGRQLGISLAKVKIDILRARLALAKRLVRPRVSHEKFKD